MVQCGGEKSPGPNLSHQGCKFPTNESIHKHSRRVPSSGGKRSIYPTNNDVSVSEWVSERSQRNSWRHSAPQWSRSRIAAAAQLNPLPYYVHVQSIPDVTYHNKQAMGLHVSDMAPLNLLNFHWLPYIRIPVYQWPTEEWLTGSTELNSTRLNWPYASTDYVHLRSMSRVDLSRPDILQLRR